MSAQTAQSSVSLFLAGDVMTGRGVDQILPVPSDPVLHEPYVKDARQYVELAEKQNGAIPVPAGCKHIWGAALKTLKEQSPEARILNLETSITTSEDFCKTKGIHYRMHPDNVQCLNEIGVDCCILANNHALGWGRAGLDDTVRFLQQSNIDVAGAGWDKAAAEKPVRLPLSDKRSLAVFAYGMPSAGIPPVWAAGRSRPGVNLLPDLSEHSLDRVKRFIRRHAEPDDLVVFSIHWGSNWGYNVPEQQVRFAHDLIDAGAVDIVYGHSSHHARPLEVYKNKLILYGCGDFINDYEGIGGHEQLRPGLVLAYFPQLDRESGAMRRLEMIPFRICRMSLQRASDDEQRELAEIINRESARFGTEVTLQDERLVLDGRV